MPSLSFSFLSPIISIITFPLSSLVKECTSELTAVHILAASPAATPAPEAALVSFLCEKEK